MADYANKICSMYKISNNHTCPVWLTTFPNQKLVMKNNYGICAWVNKNLQIAY